MQIRPVTDEAGERIFLEIPAKLFRNDPTWIRPLDKDINDVFDPKKNKAFRKGKVERWILFDDTEKAIGRIAAFTNSAYKNKGDDVPVGGIGFFECVNDQLAANQLLDHAKKWLQEHGMQAMDGPINFGERDRWWGMVTQGYFEPLYCMNYNPPYYVTLFENYGFKVFYNQICFGMDATKPLSPKILERYRVHANNPDIHMHLIEKGRLEKYALDFVEIYNKAWAGHGGLKQLSKDQVMIMFKKMKPVLDESIVYFAYHKETPICMFVNLPDLNQYFKHFDGKFGLLQKLEFLWRQRFRKSKKFVGLVFGIVPEWQGKGIDSFIIGECARIVQKPNQHYLQYEMQWIGDFNNKMINIAESLGDSTRTRQLTTFRYLFDRNKPFQRHPIVS